MPARRRRFARSLCATFLASVAMLSAVSADPGASDTAATDAYYNSVLRAMKALPSPPNLRFKTTMSSRGAGVDVYDDDGHAVLAVGFGRSFHQEAIWSAQFDAPDSVVVTTDDGRPETTRSPVFNPTWNGAYDWLRYGVKGRPSGQPVAPAIVATPQAQASTSVADSATPLATIGTVQAIGTAFYRIVDAGAQTCPSMNAGRHLHLIAYRDAATHPVTDMVVDVSTMQICSIRFHISGSSIFGVSGTYQLDFGDHDGYWLVTGGNSDLLVRTFGFAAKHVTLNFTYDYADSNPSPTSVR